MASTEVVHEGLRLLELIDDFAIGGASVTPGVRRFSDIRNTRIALTTLNDWTQFEAVHLNPAGRSLQSACQYAGMPMPSDMVDRVLILDFDWFSKDGTPREGVIPRSPEDIINDMKRQRVPLPYCYSYSATPGNFHMIWVYRESKIREETMLSQRDISLYWGADPKFTNSTIRNPIYRSLHPNSSGQGTVWWGEWTSTEPLLNDKSELLPEGFSPTSQRTPRPAAQSSRSVKHSGDSTHKFKPRQSLKSLERIMTGAKDGDGRWFLLRSFITRHIMNNFKEHRTTLSPESLRNLVLEANSLFKEPVGRYRQEALIQYWSSSRQLQYISRQRAAGASNWKANELHRQAVCRYFEVVDMRDSLIRYRENPEKNPLPPRLVYLDASYEGRKFHGKSPTYAYIAWMMEYVPEQVNPETGEVTGSGADPAEYVRERLRVGKLKKYSREEYLKILEESEQEEESDVAPGQTSDELTSESRCAKVSNLIDNIRSTDKDPPAKGKLYV